MAQGDLILTLNFNTRGAMSAIRDLARNVRNVFSSMSGRAVRNPQLDALQLQAERSIQRIQELRNTIQELNRTVPTEEWNEFRTRVNEVGREIERLEARQQELNSLGRSGSEEYARIQIALRDARLEEQRLEQQSRQLIASGRDITTQAEQQPECYRRVNDQLRQEEIRLANINSRIQNLNNTSRNTSRSVRRYFNTIGNSASRTFNKIKQHSKSTSGTIEANFKNASVFIRKGFKTLLKYGLGVRSFFFLFRKLRSAVIDAYKELAQYSDEVNKSVSGAKSALTKFRNSIAVAIQPLVQVLAPVVEKIANKMASYANNLAQFFAALTGQSYVFQALDVQEDYADSLDDTSKSADKAAKSLKRYLSPLDDINRFESNKSDDTAASTAAPKFTKAAVDNNFQTLASNIKDYFKDIFKPIKTAWDKYGKGVMEEWERLLGNIKGLIKDVGISFRNVWLNGTGERTVGNILILWQKILGTINTIIETFRTAWNKDNLGDSVIQSFFDRHNALLELIQSVIGDFNEAWANGVGEDIFQNVLNIVININNIIGGFYGTLKRAWDKNGNGKKIWKGILDLVKEISGWIEEMTGLIADWVDELDFSPILEAIPKLTDAIGELWKVVSQKLKGVFKDVLLPLAKWTIEKGLPKLIEIFAGALEFLAKCLNKIPQGVIDAIATGILSIYLAFKTAKAVVTLAGYFVKAFKLISANKWVILIGAVATAILSIYKSIDTYNRSKIDTKDKSWEELRAEVDETVEKIDNCTSKIKGVFDTAREDEIEMKVNFSDVDKLKGELKTIIQDGIIDTNEQPDYYRIIDELKEKLDGFEEYWDGIELKDINGNLVIQPDSKELETELDKMVDDWKIANAKITYESELTALRMALAQNDSSAELKKAESQRKDILERAEKLMKEKRSVFVFDPDDPLASKRMSYWEYYGGDVERFLREFDPSWLTGSAAIGDINVFKELSDSYKDVESTISSYNDALSDSRIQINNVEEAYKALYGGQVNASTAIKLVEDGVWDANTAVEKYNESNGTMLSTYEELEAIQKEGIPKKIVGDFVPVVTKFLESTDRVNSKLDSLNTRLKKAPPKVQEAARDVIAVIGQIFPSIGKKLNLTKKDVLNPIKTTVDESGEELNKLPKQGSTASEDLMNNMASTIDNNKGSVFDRVAAFVSGINERLGNIGVEIGTVMGAGASLAIQAVPLAQGAVIPAGKPFVAMLGDQTAGRNLEAPESLIRQIVREETSRNSSGNNSYTIPVQVGSRTLFTIVLDEAKLQRMQTGYNPFVKLGG